MRHALLSPKLVSMDIKSFILSNISSLWLLTIIVPLHLGKSRQNLQNLSGPSLNNSSLLRG